MKKTSSEKKQSVKLAERSENEQKVPKFKLKSLIALLPVLYAFAASLVVLKREMWFDEALTVMGFVLPFSPIEIYTNYIIPNNQIVYSIMLNLWNNITVLFSSGDPVVSWRLLSLILAAASIVVFIELREKLDKKLYPAVLVLCTAITSTIFVNYATALRGYAASWLFVMLALYGLYDVFHEKALKGWISYSIASLLAVGTVPTNLLPLAAVVLYAIPWMDEKFWRDKRFYIASAVLPLALIVFYAPIADKFLATFQLGEGFATREGALFMVLGMYIATFGILLLFAPWGIEKKPWQHTLRYLIWLLPAMAIIVLHKAPFPRVFVTLLPVLAMLVTDGMSKVVEQKWKKWHLALFFMLSLCVQMLLIPVGMIMAKNCNISPVEDDFFQPYYMNADYKPAAAAVEIEDLTYGNIVFLSFGSDPLPLKFYSAINNINIEKYRSDVPYNSVKDLHNGSHMILAEFEDKKVFEKRFNGELIELKKIGRWKIYRLKKQLDIQ